MKQITLLFLSLALIITCVPAHAETTEEEPVQIELTTYYPSPYGEYSDFYASDLGANKAVIGDIDGDGIISDGLPAADGGLNIKGNVGIGTDNPQAMLDIRGGLRVESAVRIGSSGSFYTLPDSRGTNNQALITDASGSVLWQDVPGAYWQKSDSNIYPVGGITNIGIGTSSPAYNLDVNGSAKVSSLRIGNYDMPSSIGSSGLVLKSNGSNAYWGNDDVGSGGGTTPPPPSCGWTKSGSATTTSLIAKPARIETTNDSGASFSRMNSLLVSRLGVGSFDPSSGTGLLVNGGIKLIGSGGIDMRPTNGTLRIGSGGIQMSGGGGVIVSGGGQIATGSCVLRSDGYAFSQYIQNQYDITCNRNLTVGGFVKARIFSDADNPGRYWVDPSNTTSLNQLGVSGDLWVTGAKHFKIDHPTKPNMQLIHASLEGPEVGLYYRGEGQLVNGKSEINLPDYFEVLTRKQGRTVQLTAKGDKPFFLSYSDVANGKFTVYGTKPDGEFSWEVKAVRTDIEPLKVEVLSTEFDKQ